MAHFQPTFMAILALSYTNTETACRFCNGAVWTAATIKHQMIWKDNYVLQIWILEGSSDGSFNVTILALAWRDWEWLRRTSFNIITVLAAIQTTWLLDAGRKHYWCSLNIRGQKDSGWVRGVGHCCHNPPQTCQCMLYSFNYHLSCYVCCVSHSIQLSENAPLFDDANMRQFFWATHQPQIYDETEENGQWTLEGVSRT
jgi:hypothetical protein